jgi:hypothetical protein
MYSILQCGKYFVNNFCLQLSPNLGLRQTKKSEIISNLNTARSDTSQRFPLLESLSSGFKGALG